jgi:hypothetical protein
MWSHEDECRARSISCMSLNVCLFGKNMNNINYSIQNTFLNKMTTNNNKYYLWSWKKTWTSVVRSQSHHRSIYINALKWLLYYHGIAFTKQMYVQNVIKYWHWDCYKGVQMWITWLLCLQPNNLMLPSHFTLHPKAIKLKSPLFKNEPWSLRGFLQGFSFQV